MFGLEARELSFNAFALTQGCLRGQTLSVCRQAAIVAQHNLSKRVMRTGAEELIEGHTEPVKGNQVLV